jgi:hypothetical protein
MGLLEERFPWAFLVNAVLRQSRLLHLVLTHKVH